MILRKAHFTDFNDFEIFLKNNILNNFVQMHKHA